jgi:hypothetical protein
VVVTVKTVGEELERFIVCAASGVFDPCTKLKISPFGFGTSDEAGFTVITTSSGVVPDGVLTETTVLYTAAGRPAGFPVSVNDVGVFAVPWETVNQGTVGAATEIPTVPGTLAIETVAVAGPPFSIAFRNTVDGLNEIVFCPYTALRQTSQPRKKVFKRSPFRTCRATVEFVTKSAK